MNIDYLHHDTRTDEPLQTQIKTLTRWKDPTIEEYKKEIQRLNKDLEEYKKDFKETNDLAFKYKNIIEELERYIKEMPNNEYFGYLKQDLLDKLQELKEGK